jgi:hypothetical protein
VALAGCGGSKQHTLAEARPFADGFVQRLVGGSWQSVESDVEPLLTRQLRRFQSTIRHDGMRTVLGPGELRSDCPPAPAVGAGKDCFVYRLSGRQVVPLAGVRKLSARYRLWVRYEGGHWMVVNYDYDLSRTGSSA